MAKIDSKGRVVLPQEVRERLGITAGTEVEIREEDGKAVIEPEDDPAEILDRMERLVDEAASEDKETKPLDDIEPVARKHRDAVRRGAQRDSDE
jgi:AbrB family looped-hinge helix DNA binding protein